MQNLLWKRGPTWVRGTGLVLLAALLLLTTCLPVYLLLKQAFTREVESLAWPLSFFPHSFTLAHFNIFWERPTLQQGAWLSVWVSGLATGLSLLVGVMAGWGIARMPRTGGYWVGSVSASRMFPMMLVGIPLAMLLMQGGLYNHPWGLGLVVAHTLVVLPYTILTMVPVFQSIPKELEESAMLDGGSLWQIFWRISFPLARPGVAAAAMLGFILSWDEFAYALILQITHRNLPPLVYYFTSYGKVGIASALSVLMLLPALGFAFLLDRYLKAGYLQGSLK